MTSSQSANSIFRNDINALRALAVISVIFYHFDMLGATSGYIGVDVFFVISGFLIGGQVSTQIAAGQFRFSAFIVSRIRRILSALTVVCAAVYIWGWLYMLPQDFKLLVRTALSVVAFVSNITFSGQLGYFDLGAQYKPLLHTWSLSVEAQFYLLLPFFLMIAFRLSSRLRLIATVVLTGASFTAAIVLGSRSPDTVFFAFTARAWEFLVGCLVSWFTLDAAGRLTTWGISRKSLLLLSWITLIVSCFFLPKGLVWPGPWTLIPVLLVASIILLGSGQMSGPLVSNLVVQHVGKISYSLYLWHWPLIVCWKLMNSEPVTTSGMTLWVLLAGTWGIAILSWRFVESPFRSNRAFWNSRKLYITYALIFTAFTGAGVGIWKNDGVPSRLPTYLDGAIAASQFNPPFNERCWDLPQAAPKSFYSCDFGISSDKPSIAIWGDSHSLQFLKALRETFDESQLSGILFHYPGCEPASSKQPRGDNCDIHNEEVLKWIEGKPSIKTIVIIIRQNEFVRVDRAWNAAWELLAKNYKVIFLGPLPEAKRAVAQEWATTQLLLRKHIMEMTYERDAPSRVQSFNARLKHWQIKASSMNAQFPDKLVAVDLTDTFCDSAKCWLVRDGVGLFWDADHLSPEGASLVLPTLLNVIESHSSRP